jgi:hypothetical protein
MTIDHTVEARGVRARVVARFEPIDAAEWKRLENNMKASYGKARFLEMPDTFDATSARVTHWLAGHGLEVKRPDWIEVTVAADLPPRYVSLAFTARAVDAFISRDGELRGCELKVSGSDGVCGLTVNEERLLRAGLIGAYSINPVRGLIGEMDSAELLGVPRRVDGVPVGQATIEWEAET